MFLLQYGAHMIYTASQRLSICVEHFLIYIKVSNKSQNLFLMVVSYSKFHMNNGIVLKIKCVPDVTLCSLIILHYLNNGKECGRGAI